MIMHHYSFTNLGAMLEGIAVLSKIAAMEGCADVDAIEIDGASFEKGRMTLCKKVCADNQPCFVIEFNESKAHREAGAPIAVDTETGALNFDPPAPAPVPPKRGRRPRLVA